MDEFDGYIAELYREMELELISSMKRNLALHLAEEQKTGIKYPQWQAIKLKELKRFQRENADIIGRRTKGLSKDVSEHMQSELKEGSAHEFKVYREALGQGYKSAKAVKDSFFRVDTEKVKGVINALDNDLTTANAAMFRMVNDTYRQVIYKYGFFMANGTYTYKQAYDAATKDFLERGINCIEYKDGRRVNIADYCRMAVRTSSQRAYMVGQGEVRKRIGNPLIIITKHNTSCKLCKPFERKVLIDDVYSGGTQEDGDYMLLSQAMELGLYHPNCRHGSDTYYHEREEFFEKYYKSHPELDSPLSETAADDYGEHNEAHIDNMIQRYRRLVTGSVDKENIANYQLLLDKWLDKKSAVVDKSGESGIINKYKGKGIEVVSDDEISDETIERVERATKRVTKDFKVLEYYSEPITFGDVEGGLAVNRYNENTGLNNIVLRKPDFANPEVLLEHLRQDFESGKSYETEYIESLVAHEMGHNAHIALALKRAKLKYGKPLSKIEAEVFKKQYNKISQDIYLRAFSDETYEEIQEICTEQLGMMTKESPRELIAQSFGNYYYGSTKSKVAKSIVKFFKKELR